MTPATMPTTEPVTAPPRAAAIPRIIHFTIPAKPTPTQLKNIEVARQLHPDWEVKVWQDPLDETPFRLSRWRVVATVR